jgi:hypothetical protein
MTRGGFSIFWKLFTLFYAIPFPMIMYYGITGDSPTDLVNADPRIALGLVALSIILWFLVLAGYYNKWILQTLSLKRKIEWLKDNGVKREARILTSTDQSIPGVGYSTYELNLSFKNLAGAEIEEKLIVNDTKAYERRFQAGNKVEVVMDQNPKDYPYIILSSFQVSLKIKMLVWLHIALLVIAAIIAGYYYFSYQTESEGMGWRFMVFYHPLIICALIFMLGNIRVFGKIISKLANENYKNDFLIKYKGLPAKAKLLKASETGTYINEQPMIEFALEFTDYRNQRHNVSIKKVIGLLDLERTRQKEVDICYLKEDPRQIVFWSDLKELTVIYESLKKNSSPDNR